MRTGQAHRTLLGHTGPITCLQFDEIHIVSGSLDKSIRVSMDIALILDTSLMLVPFEIWDLRSGGVFETLKYDHGVTALQFDTRKIVAATGENGVKVYCAHRIHALHDLSTLLLDLQPYHHATLYAADKRTHPAGGSPPVYGPLSRFGRT